MQKINTLYLRDKDNPKRLTQEVDPSCQWVLDGEGIATEKFDGSACLVLQGLLYRRHRLQAGKMRPSVWMHWDFEDPKESGHGWALVEPGSTADQYHWEARHPTDRFEELPDGTYELVGPKLQDNPYNLERHEIWPHGKHALAVGKFIRHDDLKYILASFRPMEGIVWHHPDGRMAKIKRRDFGLPWPVKEAK